VKIVWQRFGLSVTFTYIFIRIGDDFCVSFISIIQGFIPGGAVKPIDVVPEANFDVTEHYWFPMLAGLSDLTLDSRPEVRHCALEVLFDLLNERGHKFSSPFWESIFHRVLFPIFDHVRHAGRDGLSSSGDDWLRDTSIHSLQLICNLFNTFYKVMCVVLPLSCFTDILCISEYQFDENWSSLHSIDITLKQ
jgi:hypothetical protein